MAVPQDPPSGGTCPPEGEKTVTQDAGFVPAPPRLPDRTFAAGDLAADRFRIIRYLARGGMGEIYEAEDLELKELVALKTIRGDRARHGQGQARFIREIQLARRVTHPNVCRTFDVFHHRTDADEVTFVSMELLSGESLADCLAKRPPLKEDEAFPLVAQMAAALQAAHAVGVVHRDFKSSNVMLVPSAEGVRAVVTDFGLARGGQDQEDVALTETGAVPGTPAYMAPEQVEGGKLTAATDIYALGVVIYEMVTGKRPFVGETSFATAVKRLKEAPPAPHSLVPDLDPKWEAAILRCLERNPADRFANAADLQKALGGEKVAPGFQEQRRRKQRIALGMVAGLFLALVAGFLLSRVGRVGSLAPPPEASRPLPMKPRRSVAVLGFKNLSGRSEESWLSTALSEMLSTELAAGEGVRTISGEDVARMKIELSLADSDSFGKETLARIRTNLGTDLVVVGSFLTLGEKAGGQVRLDLRLQDAAAGETIVSVAETGTETRLFDLVSQTGARLREKLGVEGLSAVQAGVLRASLPSSPQAARLYAEGLAKLRLYDALAARDLLEKAVAADTNSALAHSALAAAWSALGYEAKAEGEAKRAFDLSASLSREERLSVEARYREMAREWEKGVEIYRTLWGFFPDNLDYGLRLAAAQTSAGSGKGALATVEALARLPPPGREDPRIDLAEAQAAHALSDFQRERVSAGKAVTKGTARGTRLLIAPARLLEGWALLNLGEPKKAMAAYEEAERIYAAAGDRGGVAKAVNSIAVVFEHQGNLAQAKEMYEKSLATCREIRYRSCEAAALGNIGNVLQYQGNLARAKKAHEESLAIYRELGNQREAALELNNIAAVLEIEGVLTQAREMYEQALAIHREVGDKSGEAGALGNIANVLMGQGDLSQSRKMHEESLSIFRELGNQRDAAIEIDSIAGVLSQQGELTQAKKMFEQALEIDLAIGDQRLSAYDLSGLGEVLLAQGDLTQARRTFERALEIRMRTGEKRGAARSRLALAELSIEEGRAAEAETPARETAVEFRKEKDSESEASAQAVLARSLLAKGKRAEARKAIDRASALSGQSQNRLLRLTVAIAGARVQTALDQSQSASKSLEAALAEAMRVGLVGIQLEARLALGELEIASGDSAAGRVRLSGLEKEAGAKGFGLIARKAAAARG